MQYRLGGCLSKYSYRLLRKAAEALVVVLEEALKDLPGLLQGIGSGQAKLHHKTVLEDPPLSLDAALGLWSPGFEHSDTQFLHSSTELGERNHILELLNDGGLPGGVKDGVAVCVEAQRNPMSVDHLPHEIQVAPGGFCLFEVSPDVARG